MSFTDQGFQSGAIKLPGLEFSIRLPPDVYFRDDGAVDSVRDHSESVCREINASPPDELFLESYGRLMTFHRDNSSGIVMIVKKDNFALEIFRKGHESSHLLIDCGLSERLRCSFGYEGFGITPFDYEEERTCDLGGLLAMYKHGVLSRLNGPELLVRLKKDLLASKR